MVVRRFAKISVSISAFCALVACSGGEEPSEEKAYDAPTALCGVEVDPELVASLLPGGDSIDVNERKPGSTRTRCQVDIDGELALIVSQMWWEKPGDSIAAVARSVPELESAVLGDDASLLTSDTGALQRVASCSSTEHPDQTLFTSIQVYGDGISDEEAVTKLVAAYSRAVEEPGDSGICQ
ncbi:hypothetical protein ACFRI7_26740 [Streptomyces sp. NPDC056716]|uniref:hypothetical protein n=1 Tax=unclassified Streptomyces TaxID=2593676 RepID=UPI00367B210C